MLQADCALSVGGGRKKQRARHETQTQGNGRRGETDGEKR